MQISDEHLMSQVKGGNPEMLNLIFNRYSKRIYAYFLRSTLAVAESDDLTQELFLRVLRYRKSYKDGQSVEIWIFQIARNMLKDHFGKLKVHRDKFTDLSSITEHNDDSYPDQQERERQLYSAMNNLSDEKRELLVLSKFEGMKYEQIALLKQTTVANIKVQVHRVLKELKDLYFKTEQINQQTWKR
ncbi:MAG: RNA polymerase sigma factor [Cyclobacteriaceae bacterium]